MGNLSRLRDVQDYETDALVADLIERVELHGTRADRLEQEVDTLRAQRDVLEAELEHATGVVAELTRRLIELEGRLADQPLSLSDHIRRRSSRR